MSSNSENSEDFLAKWLANELTPAEKENFESSEEGKDLLKIISSTDKMTFPAYNVELELQRLQERKKTIALKTKTIHPIWKLAVAAILVVGISLVYFLTKPSYEVYKTQFGETKVVTLPDNSTVTLNVNSVLKFDPKTFSENRKLTLEGEAFFEVTKGVNFEVNTSQGQIVVLGTSFNVNQRAEYLNVQVHSGVVKVLTKGANATLQKGDGLRVEDGQLIDQWQIQDQERPLWLSQNITELNNVPFSEALDALRNSFGISISSNISLTSERFTGSYPNDNVETAIQIVMSTKGLEYSYNANSKELNIIGIEQN